MVAVPRVIVTRPPADGERWVTQLQQAGLHALALPLIDITQPNDPKPVQRAWGQLGHYAALIFVSRQAVAHFFGIKPAWAQDVSGLRYLVPGPGTRDALLDFGVPATAIDAPPLDAQQFDSQALWQVVESRAWLGQRVLLVRGEPTQRNWLAQQLQAAGAQIDEVVAYQRVLPSWTAAQWQLAQTALHDGSVWLFSSSQALTHLVSLNQGHVPRLDWSQARALATHPRIAQALRTALWGVVASSRPMVLDVVASIESLAL